MTDSLDPAEWQALRRQGHAMLDDMFDYLEQLRQRPVWQPIPETVRTSIREPLPRQGEPLERVHATFMEQILPYAVGNAHPGFMGWVHGGGTPVGMLAEMLAGGLNANLGGRDQMPVEVERQVSRWMAGLFGFPADASGIFVAGTSMATLISLLVARSRTFGSDVRQHGVSSSGRQLVAYASTAVHDCLAQALDIAGLGRDALRPVPVDARQRIDIAQLEERIAADRQQGLTPFYLAGTAGSVDIGAIDDLEALAEIARREDLWFHVDGAYGALGMLAPDIAPRLTGIERADAIAFDFHKWGQVPYDAGFVLIRDAELHRRTFASEAAYLRRETSGLAGGSPWPCDFGPDLSRGFRALKTWFTLKSYGADRIGEAISRSCELARDLQQRIEDEAELELLAPVELNIVCFRYRCGDADRVNAGIAVALQEAGRIAPSTTRIDGKLAIRAAIFNHRTQAQDIEALVAAVLDEGRRLTGERA